MAAGVLKIALEAAPIELAPNERIVRVAYTEIDYTAKLDGKLVSGHVLIVPTPLSVLVELEGERWSVSLLSILRAVLDQREARLEQAHEPAEPLTQKRPESFAFVAVKYLLDRVQTDPDLYYYLVDSEAWEQLTAAEAALLGVDVKEHRRARRKDLQPEHRRRRPEIEDYKNFCDRLGIKPTDSTEDLRDALETALDRIDDGTLRMDGAQ